MQFFSAICIYEINQFEIDNSQEVLKFHKKKINDVTTNCTPVYFAAKNSLLKLTRDTAKLVKIEFAINQCCVRAKNKLLECNELSLHCIYPIKLSNDG